MKRVNLSLAQAHELREHGSIHLRIKVTQPTEVLIAEPLILEGDEKAKLASGEISVNTVFALQSARIRENGQVVPATAIPIARGQGARVATWILRNGYGDKTVPLLAREVHAGLLTLTGIAVPERNGSRLTLTGERGATETLEVSPYLSEALEQLKIASWRLKQLGESVQNRQELGNSLSQIKEQINALEQALKMSP